MISQHADLEGTSTTGEPQRPGAFRDGDRRRWSGRPRGRVPPAEARPAVRDPGRERADRRLLAHAMLGLAPALHPRRSRRAAGLALPGGFVVVPHRRTRWPTTSRHMPDGSSSRSEPESPWTGSPRRGTASSSGQETRGSRPTTSWSRQAPTESPPSPTSPASSIHGSYRCIPASTGIHLSCARATCSSSAPVTREPISRLKSSRSHRTWLSGRDKGQVPFRIETTRTRLLFPVLWFVASRVLTVKTPIGRKLRPHVLENGAPLIRVKPDDLAAAGVERVPKVGRLSATGCPYLKTGV